MTILLFMLVAYMATAGVVFGGLFMLLGFFPGKGCYWPRYLVASLIVGACWPLAVPCVLIWRDCLLDWILKEEWKERLLNWLLDWKKWKY